MCVPTCVPTCVFQHVCSNVCVPMCLCVASRHSSVAWLVLEQCAVTGEVSWYRWMLALVFTSPSKCVGKDVFNVRFRIFVILISICESLKTYLLYWVTGQCHNGPISTFWPDLSIIGNSVAIQIQFMKDMIIHSVWGRGYDWWIKNDLTLQRRCGLQLAVDFFTNTSVSLCLKGQLMHTQYFRCSYNCWNTIWIYAVVW